MCLFCVECGIFGYACTVFFLFLRLTVFVYSFNVNICCFFLVTYSLAGFFSWLNFSCFFLLQSLVKLKLFKLPHYFLSSLPCFIWYSYPGPLVHVWLSVSFFFGNLIGLCSLVQSPHIYACVSVWGCVSVVIHGNCGVCMIFSRKMSVHRWQVRYIFVIFLFALLCFTHYIKRKVTFNVFVSQSIDVVILLICCYFFSSSSSSYSVWLLRFSLVPLILFVFLFLFL